MGCGEGVQVGSPGKGVLGRVGWGRVAKAVGRVAFGLQLERRKPTMKGKPAKLMFKHSAPSQKMLAASRLVGC